jgi:heme/copper-type cytochrome/quinol oxidase subunit 2
MAELMWWLMNVVGPVLLLAVLVWLVFRRRSNRTTHETEKGTRLEYEEEEALRRKGSDDS